MLTKFIVYKGDRGVTRAVMNTWALYSFCVSSEVMTLETIPRDAVIAFAKLYTILRDELTRTLWPPGGWEVQPRMPETSAVAAVPPSGQVLQGRMVAGIGCLQARQFAERMGAARFLFCCPVVVASANI